MVFGSGYRGTSSVAHVLFPDLGADHNEFSLWNPSTCTLMFCELQYKFILQYKGVSGFFFLIIWNSFWHVNIFSKGKFSFLKWFNHNLCKKRNLYLQMMSLMASTHWGANNLGKGPRGKVRNLDGGGDVDVFVSVSVGSLSRDSDPCQCGHPLTVPSIFSKSFEKSSWTLRQIFQCPVGLAPAYLTSFLSTPLSPTPWYPATLTFVWLLLQL